MWCTIRKYNQLPGQSAAALRTPHSGTAVRVRESLGAEPPPHSTASCRFPWPGCRAIVKPDATRLVSAMSTEKRTPRSREPNIEDVEATLPTPTKNSSSPSLHSVGVDRSRRARSSKIVVLLWSALLALIILVALSHFVHIIPHAHVDLFPNEDGQHQSAQNLHVRLQKGSSVGTDSQSLGATQQGSTSGGGGGAASAGSTLPATTTSSSIQTASGAPSPTTTQAVTTQVQPATTQAASNTQNPGQATTTAVTTTATQQTASTQPAIVQPVGLQVTAEAHAFCPPLTRELLAKHARDNTVMVTVLSFDALKLYGQSFATHLKEVGITYGLVAVLDLRTARLAQHWGMPCFTAKERYVPDNKAKMVWGDENWRLHTWQKVEVARTVHQLGFHVLQSDVDVVWLQDPLPYFIQKHPQPDFLVSLDLVKSYNPVADDGLEVEVNLAHYTNTGVWFLRATPGGTVLVDQWNGLFNQYKATHHEQDALYFGLMKNMTAEYDRTARVARAFNNQVVIGQLPVTLFQNSYTHGISKLHEVQQVKPYSVHMTWTFGQDLGKIHRMRELMMMVDPPEYYNEGMYLTIGMTPVVTPAGFNGFKDSVAMAQHHHKVMTQQLRDLYFGFLMAFESSRILILPKLSCHCVHNWYASPQCRLPGDTYTQLPFDCPADHVFKMDKLYNLLVEYRRIQIREHSWLENPRTNAKYKAKPFVVRADNVPNPVHEPETLILPNKYHDHHMVAELGLLKTQPVVHIQNPEQLWAGHFSLKFIQTAFDKAMSELGIEWCCTQDEAAIKAGQPGTKFQFKVQP